jgi:hypothetical protein
MAANTDIITSSIISTTSQHKRDVSEQIRRLYPNLTKILALVKGSNLDSFGKVSYSGKGMIDKKEARRMDPEWFTYTPIDVMYLATGGSSTSVTIADSSFFETGDKLVNLTTAAVAIVNRIYDGTTIYCLAVTGGTAWTSNAGDYIAVLSSTYEEGTSRYNTVTNELTRCVTYLHTFREGVSIADTVKKTPQYTNEGMLERYMTDKMVQALRKLEGSFLFDKSATSGTTSTTIYGSGTYSLWSMNGLVSYAATAYPMGGAFNWETFNTLMYPAMPKTLQGDETLYMICGRKIAATMNQWANNKYMIVSDNKELKFGKSVRTYIMGGQLEVEVLVHELFDQGGFSDSAVFFQSSDLVYRFMTGMDVNIRENAQLPATMGQVNIIEGTVGLQSWSNGANIKWFSNMLQAPSIQS